MAKKKRLNKKVIIILASIGVVLIVGVAGVLIWKQPKNPDVYASRAAEFMKKGEYSSAVRNYGLAANVAKKTDPQKPKYLLSLAEVLLEWNRKDKSLSDSAKSKHFHEARAALQKAMRFDPKFIKARRRLTDLEYAMFLNPRRPDYKEGIASVSKLLDLVPDDHEVLYKRARVYVYLAANDTAYLEPAREDFRRLVKLAPCQEHYWFGLVDICLMSRDADRFEQAEKIYKEALAANKDSAQIRINYAQFLLRRDRKDEALQWLNDAVEACPNEAVGYLSRAEYYRRIEQDQDKAFADYEKAVEVEPADYRAYSALARIYTTQKKPAEALAILEKGLDAVRKSKKPEPKDIELRRHLVGIVVLNHQLCDALLDSPATGAEREKAVQVVADALKEMQKEIRNVKKGGDLFSYLDPYIAKVEGRLAMVDGKPIEAEKLLRRAYDSFRTGNNRPYFEPKTAELLMHLYRHLGQHGEAQKIVARAENFSGGGPQALMTMLRLYIDSRQYEQARRRLRLILDKTRTEPLLSIQASLDAVMGRSKRIPAGLKELDPLAVQMFHRRAQQLWLEGEQESAIQLLWDILARQPKHLTTMMKLIQWHKLRNESAHTDELLARARRAYKDNPRVLSQLSLLVETDKDKLLEHLLAQVSTETDPVRKSLRLAGIYRTFRKEKEYLEHLAAAESKAPKNPSVIQQRFVYALGNRDWASAEKYAAVATEINLDAVGGRMYRARLAIARGKLDEAIELVAEALRIRPRFSKAQSFMGNCYLAKGQVDRARQQYELAYSQNPSNVDALVGLMRVSAAAGNIADYTRWVEQAYKFAPQNPRIREEYLRLRSDPEEVIKHRERIRESQPKNLTNLSHLAMLYERTGRMRQAEQTFRAMVNISGGDPTTIKVLAYFLRRRNRDVEARGMLADYAAKAPDKIVAYLVWAEYVDAAGEAEQAEAIYKKAITADPKDARGYLGIAHFAARHNRWAYAAENQQKYINIAGEKMPPQAEKDLVAYLINAKKFDDAERKIDQKLQKDRTDVEMLAQKALIYMLRKDYTKAKEILDHTLKIRPEYVPALVRRADVHLANRDRVRAIADLESARQAGAVPGIGVRLANLYESTGDIDNALIVLRDLLTERPGNPDVLKSLAGLYGRLQQWSNMEKVLADGKKAWPKDTFYHRKEAEMWLQRKEPSRAVAVLDAAAKLVPDDVNIAFLRMRALVEAKRYNEALSAGKKLLEHKDIAPSVTAVIALAYAKAGNKSAAETEFSAAVKAAKSGRQLFFVLRQVRSAYPPAQAIEKLKLWAKSGPDSTQIYRMLGEMLLGQKDPKGAAEYFNKALAVAKTDRHKVLIMGRLGLIYSTLDQYDASERIYKSALKIIPDDAGILNNLAWLLAHDMKKPDQAMPYARKACELAPEKSELLDTYGYVLMLEGKYDEALDVLSRSVDKRASPANRLHLGQVYEKMKRSSAAFRQYQLGWELVKDDPGNKYYREFSEAIKRLGGTPGGSTE